VREAGLPGPTILATGNGRPAASISPRRQANTSTQERKGQPKKKEKGKERTSGVGRWPIGPSEKIRQVGPSDMADAAGPVHGRLAGRPSWAELPCRAELVLEWTVQAADMSASISRHLRMWKL